MSYKDRMPIHADFFLPARRTDLIAVKDLDLDALHMKLWQESDPRDRHSVKRPTVNNYIVAMLIAQGRMRRQSGRCYVKHPGEWNAEAVDLRSIPTPKGRWRCQFCGLDYQTPSSVRSLIVCWSCAELIGLRTYFKSDLWNEDRDLKLPAPSSQAPS